MSTGLDSEALVSLIVLSWNQRDLTLACLESLEGMVSLAHSLQTVVVDNGSTDGTGDAVRQRFPAVELLETGENLGYAGGNNIGIVHALSTGAEYVCILNNDVTAAHDFLESLLSAMDGTDDVGVVTPLIVDKTNPEVVWSLGAEIGWHAGNVARLYSDACVGDVAGLAPFETGVAPGSAMLIRREVLTKVGGFDDSFFLYYEEADWCLKVRQAGYQILAVPQSVIWHAVSASLGPNSPVVEYYMIRNQIHFIARHWSGPSRLRTLCWVVMGQLLHIVALTVKPVGAEERRSRDIRFLALRDAILGRWGQMRPDAARVCDRELV